jgi:hypothetical protein
MPGDGVECGHGREHHEAMEEEHRPPDGPDGGTGAASAPAPGVGDRRWSVKKAAEVVGLTAGIIGLITVVGGWLTPVFAPPVAPPTSRVVTEAAQPPQPTTSRAKDSPVPPPSSSSAGVPDYTGPAGTGWPLTPVSLANDYLTLQASMSPEQACQGAPGWIFVQQPDALAPLPFHSDASQWAVDNGGIPRSGNYITLTLTNRNHHLVVVDSIGARIIRRSSVLAGAAANLSGGCGGVTPSFFQLNLDTGTAKPVTGTDTAGQAVAPQPLPYKLNDEDPTAVWNLQIVTYSCDCTYIPYFTYTSEGLPGTFEMPLHDGEPWRISADSAGKPVVRDGDGYWMP